MSLLKEVIIVLPLQMRDSKQLHALLEQSRKWWNRDTAHTTERGLSVIFQAGDHMYTLTTARYNYHSGRGDSSCLPKNAESTVYIDHDLGL